MKKERRSNKSDDKKRLNNKKKNKAEINGLTKEVGMKSAKNEGNKEERKEGRI